MLRWLVSVLIAIIASTGAVWAAAPDGQEDICSSSAVIFCDNFEARDTGSGDLGRAIYKNSGMQPSDANNITVTSNPSGVFQGSRALQFRYPAGGGGVGYINPSLGAAYSELYVRWYTKWSSSFIFSPIATKNISLDTPGLQVYYIGWAQWGNTIKQYDQATDMIYNGNLNGGNLTPTLDQWYCFEFHFKLNSTPSTADGILEGWIDDVKRWNYTGQILDTRATASAKVTGFLISGYWNCLGPSFDCTQPQDQHPLMYRWVDNLVISTQRVGCLSGTPPPPPTGLTVR